MRFTWSLTGETWSETSLISILSDPEGVSFWTSPFSLQKKCLFKIWRRPQTSVSFWHLCNETVKHNPDRMPSFNLHLTTNDYKYVTFQSIRTSLTILLARLFKMINCNTQRRANPKHSFNAYLRQPKADCLRAQFMWCLSDSVGDTDATTDYLVLSPTHRSAWYCRQLKRLW
jgi:hypothetical protein